jgi:hypothetical protein
MAQQLQNSIEQIRLVSSNQLTVAFTHFCREEKTVKEVLSVYPEEDLEFTIKRISTLFDGFVLEAQ